MKRLIGLIQDASKVAGEFGQPGGLATSNLRRVDDDLDLVLIVRACVPKRSVSAAAALK